MTAPLESRDEPLDRGDAVNLARNIRETDNIEEVTRRGWLSLVDGVLRMDEELKRLYAARSESRYAIPGSNPGPTAPNTDSLLLSEVRNGYYQWRGGSLSVAEFHTIVAAAVNASRRAVPSRPTVKP